MKWIAVVLLFVSAITMAGPIEDAVYNKAVDVVFNLMSVGGYITTMQAMFEAGEITIVDYIEGLELVAQALTAGASDLFTFVTNLRLQGVIE